MYNVEKECEKLIQNIRLLCQMKSLSNNALARRAGISPSATSDLLSGKTKPQFYTLLQLCNALEVTIDELFGLNSINEEYSELDGDDSGGQISKSFVGLNAEERSLLLLYNHLSVAKKEMLRIYMDMLIEYKEM
ncbi:MAG: helix-turn-helix transcriptional regulator [Eubacteriales bacterium]|nr:helix-turn-helix transcriptional regulator [Eubacteriales bacterium]